MTSNLCRISEVPAGAPPGLHPTLCAWHQLALRTAGVTVTLMAGATDAPCSHCIAADHDEEDPSPASPPRPHRSR